MFEKGLAHHESIYSYLVPLHASTFEEVADQTSMSLAPTEVNAVVVLELFSNDLISALTALKVLGAEESHVYS